MNAFIPPSFRNRELHRKLTDLGLFDKPVCMTYIIDGTPHTISVIIKDYLKEGGAEFLLLANGSEIPVNVVKDVFPHAEGEMPYDYHLQSFDLMDN